MTGSMELLPSEYVDLADAVRAWAKVSVGPCGTPGCESPACLLHYALARLHAADEGDAYFAAVQPGGDTGASDA